ncbi:MAG: lasso peptide biosynthesis B2 protein [Sphingomicrobium sp.]
MGCLPSAELWPHRRRVATAIALLCRARILIAAVPLERWRQTLGDDGGAASAAEARKLAKQVERAAAWLPFETKCLPRAMALSWMLRRERIRHALVFAVRPAALRDAADGLHAWIEADGDKVIGDLPGPWVETLRLD